MTAQKKPEAKVVSHRCVFNALNGHFRMEEYDIEMDRHEGGTQQAKRLIFERGHAVGVLAYDPARDEVVLINEMRPGILAAGEYPYTDTLAAGGIEKGETAVEAAVRETMEEAGLVLKDPQVAHEGAFVSPGGTSEKISIICGIVDSTQVGGVFGNTHEKENIKTSAVSSDEFLRRIRSGEINDMKTMIAGYWLLEHREALKQKYAPGAVKSKTPQSKI